MTSADPAVESWLVFQQQLPSKANPFVREQERWGSRISLRLSLQEQQFLEDCINSYLLQYLKKELSSPIKTTVADTHSNTAPKHCRQNGYAYQEKKNKI